MYFNTNVDGTNIDKEFNKKEKFNFDKYKKYIFIGLGCILLILGLIFILIGRKKISYYIDLSGNREITIYEGDAYIEPGYTARDSKGNDLTDKVVVNNMIDISTIGTYEIIYTLNNTEVKRIINVLEKPTGATIMYLKGSTTIYLKVGDTYKEPGYKVIDSVDGNLGDKVTVTGRVDTSKVGTYKLIYSVTNNSGVTTSKKRVIVVMDSNISLTLNNEDYTNKNVNINIYVMDNYFDYLILPNGNKVTSKSYTYEVSDNGEYKFIIYNKLGEKAEKSINVKNIDKVSPTGSCSGTYGNGKSNITIKSSDNIGISKYILNNNTYTTSKITLNKELSMVNITIYDLAGNTTSISCNLGKTTPSSTGNKPITPTGNENIKYNVSKDTIKVWIEEKKNYYVSHIWVSDAYNQMKTTVPANFGKVLLTPKDLLLQDINNKGYQSKTIIAVNASGIVLKDRFDDAYYRANNLWNKSSVSPIVIVDGKVLRDISDGKIPNSKHITYGLKKDGYLGYYNYLKGTNVKENINTSKKIINDGIKYTFAFKPVLVENHQIVSWEKDHNIRQGLCQIDKNNFVLITNNSSNRKIGFTFYDLANYMVTLGCTTGFNLDGGFSTALLFKESNSNNINILYGNKREVADILYFHE